MSFASRVVALVPVLAALGCETFAGGALPATVTKVALPKLGLAVPDPFTGEYLIAGLLPEVQFVDTIPPALDAVCPRLKLLTPWGANPVLVLANRVMFP